MHNLKRNIIIAVIVAGISISASISAQNLTPLNPWKFQGTTIVPNNSSSSVRIPVLGATGSPCVVVSSSGTLSTTACSSGSATTTINGANGPTFTFLGTTNQITIASSAPATLTWSLPSTISVTTVSSTNVNATNVTADTLNVTSIASSPFVVGGSATTTIYGNGSVSTFGGGISATTGAFSATTTFPGSGIWTSSGNVGIGTTGPSFPLHIVNADGSSFRLRTGGQFDVVSTDNKAGYLYSRPSSGNFELGPVTTGAALLLQTRNGTNRGVFNDSGNVGLGGAITDASTLAGSSVVISSGNVGIGTTGPVATLEVSSALDEPMRMNHSQPGYFEINRASTAHDSLIAWSDLDVRKWYLGQRSTDGDTSFHLFSTAKTGGAGDVMTVLNTGNVGIGTTTPAYTLSVVGNVQFATLATTTATNYLTTDSTGKLVLASGASAGVSSWGGSASSTQTYATGTATGIGLNITTANGVHTWTPTVTSGYEIPTTASTSAWNTAGAGSTVFFTRQGNWNVTSFDVRYMSPLGAYTGESQVWFITAKGGTIKNLYIRAVSHSMNNGTKFRVRVNGVDTNINVDLATSVLTGNDTVNTASVSAGDYITVKIDTASSSSGSIGNPTAAFEIAF